LRQFPYSRTRSRVREVVGGGGLKTTLRRVSFGEQEENNRVVVLEEHPSLLSPLSGSGMKV